MTYLDIKLISTIYKQIGVHGNGYEIYNIFVIIKCYCEHARVG